MKILSREFWGTVLIFVGMVIFVFVLYDSVRPFFPSSAQDQLVKDISGFFTRIFSGSDASPVAARAVSRPPAPPVSRSAPPGLLTGDVYHTKGNYYLWLWGVRPEKKTGDKVTVEVAHPRAGEDSAFQIVAAADTNGDGKPDREIARSEMLTSERPQEYSSLTFTTPEKFIFVGNAWPGKRDTFIYRSNGPWPIVDGPFENRFYLRIGNVNNLTAGPAFTNMRISFSD